MNSCVRLRVRVNVDVDVCVDVGGCGYTMHKMHLGLGRGVLFLGILVRARNVAS